MLSSKPFEIPPYLMNLCKNLPSKPMAIVGAGHPVIMESTRKVTHAGLVDPTFIGDASEIQKIAENMNWDISSYRLIATSDEEKSCETATSLATHHEVALLMKGHVHSDSLMREALKPGIGLRTDNRASHIFHMTIPGDDRVLFITDGALNVAPSTGTMVDIVGNAVGLAHALGNTEPRVAILSGTESLIDSMPSSLNAAEVVRRANNGAIKGAIVDGPMAFDSAVSLHAAKIKGIESLVAGSADILVVPNIEMGNGLFKMMVYFMSGLAAGVVMGARVPVVLTSRADPPEARFAATAIATIVSHSAEESISNNLTF